MTENLVLTLVAVAYVCVAMGYFKWQLNAIEKEFVETQKRAKQDTFCYN